MSVLSDESFESVDEQKNYSTGLAALKSVNHLTKMATFRDRQKALDYTV